MKTNYCWIPIEARQHYEPQLFVKLSMADDRRRWPLPKSQTDFGLLCGMPLNTSRIRVLRLIADSPQTVSNVLALYIMYRGTFSAKTRALTDEDLPPVC